MYRLCFFVLVIVSVDAQLGLQCKNEENMPVDWFVMYKLPKVKTSTNRLIQSGLAYGYITSENVSKGWTLSTLSVGDPGSMPGRTLQPLYDQSQSPDMLWVVYNDQPPDKDTNEELGHTKGVVMSRSTGGIWLVHSVPHFPPPPITAHNENNNYSYPNTGTHYGQSFLCISLATQQMDLVGTQLKYNEPEIYGFNIPSSMERLVPNLTAAARNRTIDMAPWFHQAQLTSIGGKTFQSFAKSSHFNKDLYADWVAVSLRVNLLVESWLNGQGSLPSDCKLPYIVENVAEVGMAVAQINFTTHVDHSKWAVAEDKTVPWVCIGDINRMSGQEIRGGGTVCMRDSLLWSAYRGAVAQVDACPSKITSTNLIQ